MTYRERRMRRVERLRGWAEVREARASAEFGKAHAAADAIPFGQPILVGHHSERRDRNYRDRIDAGIGRAVESARMAERHNERADNIEAAAAHAIYSDDTDAVDRLAERIALLEAERDRIKAFNASCRKGSPDPELLPPNLLRTWESTSRLGLLGKNGAMPGYVLTNLSGNISRQRKRLEALLASA